MEEARKEVLILFSWPQLWVQPVIRYLVKRPGREEGEILVEGPGCRAGSGYLTRRRAGSSTPESQSQAVSCHHPHLELGEDNEKLKNTHTHTTPNHSTPPFTFLCNRN